MAERMRSALSAPYDLLGRRVAVSSSMGIVLSAQRYTSPEDILRDADTAMYCAKALGGMRHVVFDVPMRDQVVARLDLETNLRFALEGQEFQMYYQPVTSLQGDRIIGFEASVRWQHPERGLLQPISDWLADELLPEECDGQNDDDPQPC